MDKSIIEAIEKKLRDKEVEELKEHIKRQDDSYNSMKNVADNLKNLCKQKEQRIKELEEALRNIMVVKEYEAVDTISTIHEIAEKALNNCEKSHSNR